MVAERDGLGGLQMREARHDGARMDGRLVDERALEFAQRGFGAVAGRAHPHFEVERDLVVARAGHMQALGGLADQVGQPRFDVHVDVFEFGLENELALFDFPAHLLESAHDRGHVFGLQDFGVRQHLRMRGRARNVFGVEPPVDVDRGIDPLHDRVGGDAETTAPHRVGGFLFGTRSLCRASHGDLY